MAALPFLCDSYPNAIVNVTLSDHVVDLMTHGFDEAIERDITAVKLSDRNCGRSLTP